MIAVSAADLAANGVHIAVGFGASPNDSDKHRIVEFELSLNACPPGLIEIGERTGLSRSPLLIHLYRAQIREYRPNQSDASDARYGGDELQDQRERRKQNEKIRCLGEKPDSVTGKYSAPLG